MTDRYAAPVRPEDLSVGDSGPELVVESVDREDFVRYAGASGDFSRLHYDEPHVKSLGYESVFAQGMLTTGFASHLVSDWFGLERITRFRVRFRDQVWPGDTVTVTGEVTDVSEREDRINVEASIRATTGESDGDADGTIVLTGEVTATFPTEGG